MRLLLLYFCSNAHRTLTPFFSHSGAAAQLAAAAAATAADNNDDDDDFEPTPANTRHARVDLVLSRVTATMQRRGNVVCVCVCACFVY